MDDFGIYRTFIDKQLASEINMILETGGISTKLIDNSPSFDISFANNPIDREIQLLIKQTDFTYADELLANTGEEKVDKDHYLFDFSSDELYEILAKPDEWSQIDYKLSQKILIDRGEEITPETINAYKKRRISELEKPEKSQIVWVIIGYIFAFLGGFLGALIGWFIFSMKKTLPDGRKVYTYRKKDRFHGTIIFWTGIIVLFCLLIYNLIEFKKISNMW